MNEGYQDREDPGLTVRLPAGRPAGRVAAGLDDDAVDARPRTSPRPSARTLRYVRVRQGDDAFWLGKGTLKTALAGPVRGRSRSVAGARPGRLALRGPVRRPAGGPRRRSPRHGDAPARTSIGSSPGTRSARTRAPASSTSPRAAAPRTSSSARRSGLPVIAPLDEDGRYLDGFGWLTGREASARRRARSSRTSSGAGCFYHLEPYTHRYPHCWRCGTPLVFRLVDEWFIAWARSTTSRARR